MIDTSVANARRPGQEAIRTKGWIGANKWLVLRRFTQLAFLMLFLAGPWFGLWIVKGTLASSETLGILPLTDPFIAAQSFAAGHVPETAALLGAVIVALAYVLVGGRVYCAWICPVNPLTDGAAWARDRLGLGKGWQPPRALRIWLLAVVVVVSAVTGTVAWEWVNPVTVLHRGLVFGTLLTGLGGLLVVAVVLFDLGFSRHGWCGRVCPVGAFYGLLGRVSRLRVSAFRRQACDACMDCYRVCPEPQVITPALKPKDESVTPVILAGECTNCARCVDVCAKNVFRFALRSDGRVERTRENEPKKELKLVA